MRVVSLLVSATLMAAAPVASVAQDANFLLPIDEIETLLREAPLDVVSVNPSRGLPAERTYQVTVNAGEGRMLLMKYAPARPGGDEFNNRPRYELAAYELQKLFLDPADCIVPPTVGRFIPLDQLSATLAMAPSPELIEPPRPTFDDWSMGFVVLQYWLWNVEVPDPLDLDDDDRLASEAYERHLAHFNLLTFLIRHSDSNEGNFLLSTDPENPRVFSVDNGVAFSSEASDRGYYWRRLRLDRYPREAIDRLRAYTLEDLYERLGVIAQFEIGGGRFVQTEATENLDPDDGVRRSDTFIQFGLTAREIRQIHDRITRLLGWVDDGRYEVF